ncbi:MAG: DUF4268 domain-containing protein [Chitinophagaceae bacterium]|nr:DUF4268 domain-containing protein [Chitinophagaceae bacterium]
MYTNEEISKIRKKFWASFGQYMKPVPGAGYDAVNWLNYKTGIRNIFFRMDAGNQKASIGIEIRHATNTERQHYYNQFVALKKILEQSTVYEWHWQADAEDDNGQVISRISQSLYNVTILKEADWPAIIAFLKPRMVSLDGFWEMVKDGFE